MSTSCTRVTVSGRVQGVFYRRSCADEAQRQGVRGYVRNLPDGRVEALFVGSDEAVAAMIAWCRRGPAMAVVESIAIERESTDERFDEFRIRRG